MSFSIHAHGSYNVVGVSQAMVGETAGEIAVEPLVGGCPQTIPSVHQQVFDEVKPCCYFLHVASVVLVERVLVGYDQTSVGQRPDNKSVAALAEVERGLHAQPPLADRMDAVGGESQQPVVGTQQAEDVVLGCQTYGPILAYDVESLWGRHVEHCGVHVEPSIGSHEVEHRPSHLGHEAFGRKAAQTAVLLLLVFQQHKAFWQAPAVVVVEQPLSLWVYGNHFQTVKPRQPLPAEVEGPHRSLYFGKPHDVEPLAFQKGGERTAVEPDEAR